MAQEPHERPGSADVDLGDLGPCFESGVDLKPVGTVERLVDLGRELGNTGKDLVRVIVGPFRRGNGNGSEYS
jgi:hypothetical protein